MISNARLRELADLETRPVVGDHEVIDMAEELIASRDNASSASAIDCKHPEFSAAVTEHPWDDGSGVVVGADITCTGCGVLFRNAREAREAGVFPQVDAARGAALDAHYRLATEACLSRERSAAKDADEIAMLREANTAWQRKHADLEAQRRDDSSAGTADPFAVEHRTDEVLLKLLDGIERDITDGRLPGPHVEAFEALCRSGRARSGR